MTLSWSFGADVPATSRSDSRDGVLAPGQRFGPYRIQALLGEGGSSRVYRATDAAGREVALKLLKATSLDATRRERFLREGQATAGLEHPGIVRVLAGGEVEGLPFLAYELVPEATDLRARLSEAGLAGRVRLLRAAAAAVAHAHAAGVVHRDLKPSNLLVDGAGQVRVADFGLALVQGQARLTHDGEVVGTPRYMAPEQTTPGPSEPGPPADVWALGVLLYEALTGQRPFPAARWLELRAQIQQARPAPPRAHDPTLPAALEAVCLRALALHPEQRYPDAGAFAAALDAALASCSLPDAPDAAPPLTALSPGSGSSVFPLGEVGGFTLLEVLGRGGMGIVYRARDHALGREVALKFILDARGNARRLERFRREGQVTASLNHPAILKVHGAGELEGIPYLEYELVPEARSLKQACRALALRDRLTLLRDAARGLGHAHAHGVVHRDVKPDNVLVDTEGRVLVADFGLAAAGGMQRLTLSGAMVGTPHYMAPELAVGERDKVGPPTDVWALGVLLFELLAGRLPFDAQSLVQLSVQIASGQTPSPRDVDPSIDRGLEAICAKALRKEPELRYAHGDAFADDLDAWLSGAQLSASTPTARRPLARGASRALPVALAVGGVLGAGLFVVLSRPGGAKGPSAAGVSAVETQALPPAPSQPARLSAAEVTAGRAEWTTALAMHDPEQQVALAYDWLRRYPQHPEAPEVERFVAERRFSYPLRTLRHADDGTSHCVFVAPGKLLVAGADGTLTRWNLDTGALEQRWAVSSGEPMPAVKAFVATADLAVLGTQSGLYWFDLRIGKTVTRIRGPRVNALRRSPDGSTLAVAEEGPQVRAFAFASGARVHTFSGYPSSVATLAYSPDGGRLLTLVGHKSELGLPVDCELWIWDLADPSQEPVRTPFPTLSTCAAVSPDGARIVVGTVPGQLYVRNARTGRFLFQFEGDPPAGVEVPTFFQRRAHDGGCKGVAYSGDGATLYSVSQGNRPHMNQLRVWDVATRRERRTVVVRPYDLQSLALSPDGTLLAIGTDRGTVEVWATQ
ncbi:MAG: protein kinase [Planctomycetes bacterium]|nr:protein kinase [Planctomycetota bacterium]